MDHGIVEEVVELFEEDSSSHLDEILKTVKAEHHCSETEIDSIKKEAETLLACELLETERHVDVC
ncbi:hypothetical protein [Dehalogenimonas sp. 4OHTPN]|uniref:Uncharacterized protein n=1 Tax=Dehalogenimonas sp. 4OHTPN TaxID=3166643 RepID=A0AAU8G960_9CHLR